MTCVVFDFDNTLVPTRAARRDLFFAALREWNPTLEMTQFEEHWKDAAFADVVRACAPEADYEGFLESYDRRLKQHPVTPLPCARELLEALKGRGTECIVFTGTSRRLAMTDLDTSGLLPYVSLLVAAENTKHPKPDPRAADCLARELARRGAALDSVKFVGDSLVDAAFARDLGCPFFAVTTGRHQVSDFLEAGVSPQQVFTGLCALRRHLCAAGYKGPLA